MTADNAPATVLGLGIVGAGGFAEFVCSAAADLPDVAIAAVTDTHQGRAEKLAGAYTADTAADRPRCSPTLVSAPSSSLPHRTPMPS